MSLPISVIVPVYNAGKHFNVLLDSILAQTFTQFELILVLDCPTDGSDKVAKAYAQKDSRIVIVENEHNLHTGYSRNKGLLQAKGNYIAFADHDDYVQPTWLEQLYQTAIETDADVVVCDYENRYENKSDFYRFPATPSGTDEPTKLHKGMLQTMLCSHHSVPNTQSVVNANCIWNQLYQAQLIKQNGIQFPDNKKLSYEDALFSIQVFLAAQKVVSVTESLYVHIVHASNTYDNYAYKSEIKTTAYLQQLLEIVQKNGVEDTYFGEAVLRKYFVCLFNEYKFKGAFATMRLLIKLRKHAFKLAVKAYKQTRPNLSLAKKLFLLWLA